MKTLALNLCAALAVLALVYLAIGVDHAPLIHHPAAAAGLGLIGLGATLNTRRRQTTRPRP